MNIVNLTTGLEFLSPVKSIIPDGYSYLRSSHLESKAWQKFIDSIDANIIYYLAKGRTVKIYDCGSRRIDGCSRVIWQGLPLIKYCLERAWGLKTTCYFFRNHNAEKIVSHIYNNIDKKNIRYFKSFVVTEKVNLIGIYKKSEFDGKLWNP